MTPVERLQAAIERLESVKDAPQFYPDQYMCTDAEYAAALDRITTLGRTIDAQLAILRLAATAPPAPLAVAISRTPILDAALALADAILGGDQ